MTIAYLRKIRDFSLPDCDLKKFMDGLEASAFGAVQPGAAQNANVANGVYDWCQRPGGYAYVRYRGWQMASEYPIRVKLSGESSCKCLTHFLDNYHIFLFIIEFQEFKIRIKEINGWTNGFIIRDSTLDLKKSTFMDFKLFTQKYPRLIESVKRDSDRYTKNRQIISGIRYLSSVTDQS